MDSAIWTILIGKHFLHKKGLHNEDQVLQDACQRHFSTATKISKLKTFFGEYCNCTVKLAQEKA